MTKEELLAYQENCFVAYFVRVIQNEAIDAHRVLDREAEQRVSLSSLTLEAATEDAYALDSCILYARDRPVTVRDPDLFRALSVLPPRRRDILLLFHFLEYTEPEIGRLLHLSTPTVHYHHKAGLDHLRRELEAMHGRFS